MGKGKNMDEKYYKKHARIVVAVRPEFRRGYNP
jgi:hypothetical protein